MHLYKIIAKISSGVENYVSPFKKYIGSLDFGTTTADRNATEVNLELPK